MQWSEAGPPPDCCHCMASRSASAALDVARARQRSYCARSFGDVAAAAAALTSKTAPLTDNNVQRALDILFCNKSRQDPFDQGQFARFREAMIAVLDERDLRVRSECFDKFQRVLPRHIGIAHALNYAHRTAESNPAVEEQMLAAVLNQHACARIGVRPIRRWRQPLAFLQNFALYVSVQSSPQQNLREIGRRRDQQKSGDALR